MSDATTIRDRAAGAVMGAFVGEALGLGPHWYYDLDEMRRDYGPWITDYTDPRPDRYHAGLKAGQLSQAGYILKLLLSSLVACGGYDEADFCRRLDEELLPLLDGTPVCGPGGYTSQSIRELWRQRVERKLPWGRTGGHADTTEAAERTLALAVRYACEPDRLAAAVAGNCVLTQIDDTVVSMTTAYGAVLGMLVQGHPLDEGLSARLMALVARGELPFHAVTTGNLQPPRPGEPDPPRAGTFASPDALLTPSYVAAAAADPKSGSSRHGRSPSSTACPAPSITSCRRSTIWRPVFATISRPRSSMPSTAAARTRPGPCSPVPWSAPRSVFRVSPGALSTAWRNPPPCAGWPKIWPHRFAPERTEGVPLQHVPRG